MNKFFKFTISLLLALTLLVGCAQNPSGSAATDSEETNLDTTIKIGAVFPLTGENASFGQSSKNGIDLLVEQTNANGGINGQLIEVIYEDGESKPAISANAAQKLINNDNVIAILGPVTSKAGLAIGPIATQNQVPMITSTGTNPKVTLDGGDYVYRACFIDPFQGSVLAKLAQEELGAVKAAVLYDMANDYSKGLADFFKEGFESLGGEVVAFETYSTGDTDFNAQLTQIKATEPDVLLLPDYYNTVGLIAKQARATGIDAILLGGDGWDSPDLFAVGGDAVNGAYFSNHYSPDDTSEMVVSFRSAYEKKFDSTPDAMAALAYDAGKILLSAIEESKSTHGPTLIETLNSIKVEAVSGTISYDENRNPIKEAAIIQIKEGSQEFFKKVSP